MGTIHSRTRELESELDKSLIQLRYFSAFLHEAGYYVKDDIVEGINLRGCNLNNIPQTMTKFQHLTHLDMTNNNLINNFHLIGHLYKLKELYLSGNYIEDFPEEICKFSDLRILDLCINLLTSLPEQISDLKNLHELSLSRNVLTELPISFGKLCSLNELVICRNPLLRLPVNFGSLKQLEKLTIADTNLRSLPNSFGQLKSLQELFLAGNYLEALPDSFGNLISLKNAYLRENKLQELPSSFKNLWNLEVLDLKDNEISSFPKDMVLNNLNTLVLKGNPITDVSKYISKFPRLKVLHVDEMQMDKKLEKLQRKKNLIVSTI